MDRENKRELTLKEEADAFEKAALAEMLKAKGYGESSMVNSVLQSGRRVVYRAMQELARRAEVVHGRWEEIDAADYKCSRCGFRFTSGDPISMFQYCRCGAKMDGGNEDGSTQV